MDPAHATDRDEPAHEGERALLAHARDVCLRHFDPRELRRRGETGVEQIARGALPMLACRRPCQIGVRVRAPADARGGRSAVELNLNDSPFLVDTLRLTLRRLGLRELLLVHVLLDVARDAEGRVSGAGADAEGARRESFMYAEIPPIRDADAARALEQELARQLEQVAAAVGDHRRMLATIREHAAEIEYLAGRTRDVQRGQRVTSFLEWLADDNFVFLGYRRYRAEHHEGEWSYLVDPASGLGILRDPSSSRFLGPVRGAKLPEDVRARLDEDRFVFFEKSRMESTIHRQGRLDCIHVKMLDETGRATGFGKFLGLLTHNALRTPPSDLPLLAYRRDQVLQSIGAAAGSHSHKAAIQAYDSLPLELLFSFDVAETTRAVRRVLDALEHGRVEVFVGTDRRQRSFFVSVILPRRAYDESLRRALQRLLVTRYGVTYVDHRSSFVDDEVALIHFFCSAASDVAPATLEELEREIELRATRWEDRFERALVERNPAARAYALVDEYAAAFPEGYRVTTAAVEAAADVERLEALRTGDARVELRMGADDESGGAVARLKVFQRTRPFLTDLLPALDHFGLRVLDATLTEVRLAAAPLWITSFRVERGAEATPEADERLLAGLRAVLDGHAEDDALNRLILGAGLDWREADLVRAYLAYARQLGAAPDAAFTADALLRHRDATRRLVDRFRARFDPDASGARDQAEAQAARELARAREPIPTSAEDRVFGLLDGLVRATVRTSFFAPREPGVHEIALKLDPRRLDEAPEPRPFAEIFVHSAEFAGVHLRGGAVARGGLRWSDRPHDFRSEILRLMKTQMVKNGLIVPVGAKGGFVLKRRIDDRATARREADRIYARFVRRLLRLTDDLRPEGVVTPAGVVRHDGDDPYLVVAADKGTAHLSDTANAVAAEEGFWLGDAFASGGSNGYDHKALGITARGAWVAVRRHLAELGIDPDRQRYTMAGIGDMSGDVFGNGLLLARGARFVAAFDHRHVFLDPDPEPEAAWLERKRLFELPGSSWRDYDPAKISPGGGVWDRSARSIPLPARARQLLHCTRDSLSGEDLVQAILRMPVDLLWFGGIGTYVKSSRESHGDVGDRANDGVRVNARELRARVIAEGANLGMTQLARAEYALCGGRSNTDAVDNSGGVDLSDHEVNYKVALASLEPARRSALLRACAPEAVAAVLAHNEAQSRCLSLDRLRVEEDPERFMQSAVWLSRHAGLNWKLEALPEREELRARTGASGRPVGYTRPELAILLGYSKMLAKRELAAWEPVERDVFAPLLLAYFPAALAEHHAPALREHRLRREITASQLANRAIDRAGVTLLPELTAAAGASIADAIAAWHVSDLLLDAESLRAAIGAEPASEAARLRALLRVEEAVRAAARSRLGLEPETAAGCEQLERWRDAMERLRERAPAALAAIDRERVQAQVDALCADGIGRALAERLAVLPWLVRGIGAVSLASEGSHPLERALEIHAAVGEATRITWLLDRLEGLRRYDGWDRIAAEALHVEMLQVQRALTLRAIESDSAIEPLAPLRRAHGHVLQRIEETAQHIESDERGGLAPLAVLSQQIRRLC